MTELSALFISISILLFCIGGPLSICMQERWWQPLIMYGTAITLLVIGLVSFDATI